MRFVFIDEAGISEHETVSIVVGIIVHADEQLSLAEPAVTEALGAVPAKFCSDTFHAEAIYGDKKYQNDWSLTGRLSVLNAMMSLPRRLGLAVSLGVVWRGRLPKEHIAADLRPWELDHVLAFQTCVAMADRGIRNHGGQKEIGTIVAEDCRDMRRFLSQVPGQLRDNPIIFGPGMLRETASDQKLGYIAQTPDLRVTRIRRTIHFVGKKDDPLVQIADACAYGFRRYFEGQKFGIDYARSILGNESALADFAPPSGGGIFWPRHLSGSNNAASPWAQP